MSIKQDTTPYLEKKDERPVTTEQLIYGGGDTISEVKKKSTEKTEQLLTEG